MDIVERLRLHAAKGKFMQAYFAKPDMREAADEIERLREALLRIAAIDGGSANCRNLYMKQVAVDAIKGR